MRLRNIICGLVSLVFVATVHAENLNSVVAVVNNQVITQSDMQAALAMANQQLAASQNPKAINTAKLRSMVLNQLIDQKLQLELAKRANIQITPAQVSLAIQHIAVGNHLTVDQLKSQLTQEGTNFADYQKLIHRQLVIHQVQQSAIGNEITVTPQDIAAAQAQFKAQPNTQQFHLIDMVADTQPQAQKIADALKKGVDIKTVALNKTNDMGWQTEATLPSVFLAELKTMKPGDVSQPIHAPNGFHIIKLIDVRGQSMTKQQLQNVAYQIKFQKAVEKWMTQIRKTAYIKINAQ